MNLLKWLIPLFGLGAGIVIGSLFSWQIPLGMAKYLSIAVLAALDSVLGGIRGIQQESFKGIVLLTGFVSNALLAALLAFLGDMLGVDLYMAAVFVFGIRIFQNLSDIRHSLLDKFMGEHTTHSSQNKK